MSELLLLERYSYKAQSPADYGKIWLAEDTPELCEKCRSLSIIAVKEMYLEVKLIMAIDNIAEEKLLLTHMLEFLWLDNYSEVD